MVMARVPTNPRDQRARERFFVEVAPGHVRLRHQLGLRTRFGRGRLGPLIDQVVRQLEDLEEAGESIEFNRFDPDEEAEILAAEEQERRENEELFLDTLDPDEVADYCGSKELETARKAAEERLGRGAKGMPERSRRARWRWVLSTTQDGQPRRRRTEPSGPARSTAGCWRWDTARRTARQGPPMREAVRQRVSG